MAPEPSPREESQRIDRREVIARAAALAAGAGLSFAAILEASAEPPRSGPGGALSDAEWATLAAVQETLWPGGDGVPGATELKAAEVLDAALSDPDVPPIEKQWVVGAIPALHEMARARGGTAFERLPPAKREEVLAAYREKPEGEGWMRIVLGYTLEAVLGDPVHGGNPGEAGWKWAGFEPPELRPPPGGVRPLR